MPLPDGLYRVTTSYLCAGFVIAGGQLIACAPILVRKFAYFSTIAIRVEPLTQSSETFNS